MSCKYQIKLSSEILKVAKEGWNPSNPAGIHWDGKIMHTLKNKNAIEDRSSVLVSGVQITCYQTVLQ